jgi:hypothetical protein
MAKIFIEGFWHILMTQASILLMDQNVNHAQRVIFARKPIKIDEKDKKFTERPKSLMRGSDTCS